MLAFKCFIVCLMLKLPTGDYEVITWEIFGMNSNVPLIHKPWKSIGKLWKIDKSPQSGQVYD